MIQRLQVVCLLLTTAATCPAQTQWVLVKLSVSYHMSHPVHQVDGVSTAAKGKGNCNATQCDFLIAAPVKSFNSGDTNRDLHMIEATRGAQFPKVVVRTTIPESTPPLRTLYADLQIACAVFKAARLDKRWLDEMEFLPFWARHIHGYSSTLVVIGDDLDADLFPHRKDWMLRWNDLSTIDAEENVSRLNAGDRGGPAGVEWTS